jgi:predicted nucleotidyltransferase
MYLFGSALNSNFNDNSDIDFLVKFKSFELSQYFDLNLKENLKKLVWKKLIYWKNNTQKPILINS